MSAPWRVGLLKHTAGDILSILRRRCRTRAYFAAGCRQTLEYTRVNDNFISRTAYRQVMPLPCGHWRRASACWPWVTAVDDGRAGFDALLFPACLLEVGVLVALSGVVLGGLLDIWRYEKRI